MLNSIEVYENTQAPNSFISGLREATFKGGGKPQDEKSPAYMRDTIDLSKSPADITVNLLAKGTPSTAMMLNAIPFLI